MTISIRKTCLLVYTLRIKYNDIFSVATDQQSTQDRLRVFAGDAFHITIRGQCMLPCLEDGQRVPVIQSSLYLPGDIIVFEDKFGQVLAHRLLGAFLRGGRIHFLTQADNAAGVDAAIHTRQIIGKIRQPVSLAKRLFSIGRFVRHAGKWMAVHAVR